MNPEARQHLINYEREKRAQISVELAKLNLAYQVSLETELALVPIDNPSLLNEPMIEE